MKIFKEYCEEVKKCVIRTNCYGHSLEIINKLVAEARKDFPGLSDDEIEIVQFAGRHYARTYGIEFNSSKYYPEGYSSISQLELTF
jgi:hypothetical protein